MGTKIKPAYKSEFPMVSEGVHIFRIIEAKIDTIAPEDREKTKEGIENDKNFVVRSATEGGEDDGVEIQDFFPHYSKKEFGMARLAGLMVKAEAIPPTDEIDVDTMRTEKFETKFRMSLPKRVFGGRVKHVKSTKKDSEAIFANIVEYFTVKEAQEKMAEIASKGPGEVSTKGAKVKVGDKGGGDTGKATSGPDPWA
jgi:hypothetical protein